MLSVLAYHLGLPLRGGFVGVDIFFVISGFLITRRIVTSIEAGEFSFREFYLARIRRILPAMIVTTLLTVIAGAVLMSPGALQDLAGSAIASVASVSNIYFWLDSGYFTADSSTKALLHTWSLGVEEQFYLLWPMMLVAISLASRRWMPVAVAVAGIASLAAAVVAVFAAPSAAFFLMPFRICEFAIGAVLVWALRALPALLQRFNATGHDIEILTLGGVSLMLVSVLMIDNTQPFPGLLALGPCASAAMVILFGAQSRAARAILANPVAIWIGARSYSLYLVHWPIIVLAEYALSRELTDAETLVAFVACLVAAAALYTLVEQPFRCRSGRVFAVGAKPLLLAVAGLAALTILPAWNMAATGWQWRLGERAAAFRGIGDAREFHVKYFGGTGCSMPRCETHPGVTKTAYLIGDSHARAYYAGLKAVFPEVNFVIYGLNSCPMYSNTISHFDEYTPDCVEARQMAFSEIKGAAGPIFMAHSWAARMNSPHAAHADDEPIFFKKSPDRFAPFVRSEIIKLEQMIGRPIILFGGVPRFGGPISPLDCASRPIRPDSCDASPLSGYVAEQLLITKALLATGATVLDPYSVLCNDLTCRDADEQGRAIYSDRTHLSTWGSVYLVKGLAPEIARYLEGAK